VQTYFEELRKIKARVTFLFDFQEQAHYALSYVIRIYAKVIQFIYHAFLKHVKDMNNEIQKHAKVKAAVVQMLKE